jgi:hypothetical protein
LFFCSDNFYHYWCMVFFVLFCAFVVSWYFFWVYWLFVVIKIREFRL